MPWKKYEERKRACVPLQGIVFQKVPKFLLTIALQRCKLIRLAVRYSRLSRNCYSSFLSIAVLRVKMGIGIRYGFANSG